MAGNGKKGGGGSGSGDSTSEIRGNRKDNLLIGTESDDRIMAATIRCVVRTATTSCWDTPGMTTSSAAPDTTRSKAVWAMTT